MYLRADINRKDHTKKTMALVEILKHLEYSTESDSLKVSDSGGFIIRIICWTLHCLEAYLIYIKFQELCLLPSYSNW